MSDLKRLADIFARLGADNPERWARSQVDEGMPQLARFLFLRQAWRFVVNEGDNSWIASHRGRDDSSAPGAAIGPALERLIATGMSEDDLTTVVRVMQWELLTQLCYLLDDPGEVEHEARDVVWRLFQVDQDGRPLAVMGGLHESVLETDPSGREMRPDRT